MSIMYAGAKDERANIEDRCRAGSWEREVTQMAVMMLVTSLFQGSWGQD